MRSKLFLATALSMMIVSSATIAQAGKNGKSKDQSGEVPDNISKQFQWEEKVVGPNDKKIDHDKIAAMQAAARKEEAAHKNEPTVKKQTRAAGIAAPSTASIPTQDIEKPAPAAAPRAARPKPAVVQRQPDSLDKLLDSEKETPSKSSSSGSDNPLGKILAQDDDKPAAHAAASSSKSKTKHARH
jgi:hypothetical protein